MTCTYFENENGAGATATKATRGRGEKWNISGSLVRWVKLSRWAGRAVQVQALKRKQEARADRPNGTTTRASHDATTVRTRRRQGKL